MTAASDPLRDEPARLAALHRYEILDTSNEAAFDRITSLVKTIFNVPICAVSLIDEHRQWFKSCVGLSIQQTTREISFCTRTIQQNEPLIVPDATQDDRFAHNPLVTGAPYIRSYIGAPLCTPEGYNVGSICAIDLVPRTFSAEQVQVLKSFAALVTDELELRRIAQTDSLTGAATRRGFTHDLDKTFARFQRTREISTLLILDVDHFKAINDTYGHPAGDSVLRSLARSLQAQLRQSDTLGRLGGEEFGILLQGADRTAAWNIAERMRSGLDTPVEGSDPAIHVTASFGVAALTPETASVQAWMVAADEALYDAKRSGRNRCCMAAG